MIPDTRLRLLLNGAFRALVLDTYTTGLPDNQWNYICVDLWDYISQRSDFVEGNVYRVERIFFDIVDYSWWVDEFVITTSIPQG